MKTTVTSKPVRCDQMLKSKVAKIFQTLPQKCLQQFFLIKRGVFYRNSPKVNKYLGYFCNEYYAQEITKNRPIWSHWKPPPTRAPISNG